MQLLESPAKIVFILVALTVCASFLMGQLDSKDFMVLASMAFTFYFAAPALGRDTESTDIAGIASK